MKILSAQMDLKHVLFEISDIFGGGGGGGGGEVAAVNRIIIGIIIFIHTPCNQ